MKVFEAICLDDFTVVDGEDRLDLKRGTEYTVTSVRPEDDTLVVFSRYWARVPARIFASPRPLGGHKEPWRPVPSAEVVPK